MLKCVVGVINYVKKDQFVIFVLILGECHTVALGINTRKIYLASIHLPVTKEFGRSTDRIVCFPAHSQYEDEYYKFDTKIGLVNRPKIFREKLARSPFSEQ